MINIVISNTSEKPIYQQLYEQISSQILKGEIKSHYSLPSIRTMAKELRISIITVKKAWEELEHNGFIYTMAGRGCFVAEIKSQEMAEKRDHLAKEQMLKDISYYKELGLSKEELIHLIDQLF